MRKSRTSQICLSLQEHNLCLSTNFTRSSCTIFGDTEQIEKRDWKCKECARQTKGCKNRSSKKTNLLAGLPRLIKASKSWKEINPIVSGTDNARKQGAKFRAREKTFHANETTPTQRGCVYCDATDHKAVNCNKFVTVGDRRKQLGLKQLCFNCTGSRHRAAECKCRSGCQICRKPFTKSSKRN